MTFWARIACFTVKAFNQHKSWKPMPSWSRFLRLRNTHSCQVCHGAAHRQQVSCASIGHRMGTNTQQNPPAKLARIQLPYLGCTEDPGSCPQTAVTALLHANSFYSLFFSKLPLKFSITNLFPMNSCTMLKFAQEMLDTAVV